MGEIEQTVAEGFDRVFVGHHHDAEELGPFVMPGSTEVQNLAEAETQKSVVMYPFDLTSPEGSSAVMRPVRRSAHGAANSCGVVGIG